MSVTPVIGPFVPGGYGYLACAAQTAPVLSGLYVKADPTAIPCTTFVGWAPIPGYSKQEGLRPVEGAGSYRVVEYAPGLRRYNVPLNNVQLCDGTILESAVRGVPSSTTNLGLPWFALEFGAQANVDAGVGAYNALDCLFNTWTLTWRPNAQVMFSADVWPMVILPIASPTYTQPATGSVLRWEQSGFANGAYDITGAVNAVSVQGNNNLVASPGRPALFSGAELLSSRTPWAIRPAQETVQSNITFWWDVPGSMEGPADWGSTTFVATNVDPSAAVKNLTVTLGHAYVNEKRAEDTAVTNYRQASTTVPIIDVTIAYA